MKNDTSALKVLLYTAGGAAALAGVCAYLVAPGKRDKQQRALHGAELCAPRPAQDR